MKGVQLSLSKQPTVSCKLSTNHFVSLNFVRYLYNEVGTLISLASSRSLIHSFRNRVDETVSQRHCLWEICKSERAVNELNCDSCLTVM